ncbi:hypothetical protein FRX31_013030 [Thalictrum thalictroides]|uniref:Uncharacterized protein n=1 Tax=Thalictrum thalictroides TaxID=46969 RepID=A0A7J6WKB2_THATH|nr:hypothetical protein FRX31_013030 [Thalictrum thalictroides]
MLSNWCSMYSCTRHGQSGKTEFKATSMVAIQLASQVVRDVKEKLQVVGYIMELGLGSGTWTKWIHGNLKHNIEASIE